MTGLPLRPLRGLRLQRARRMFARRIRWFWHAPPLSSRVIQRAAINRYFPMAGKWKAWR